MKKRFPWSKKINKTFSTIMLTYLVVLIFPLLTSLVNYFLSSSTIKQQSVEQMNIYLQQLGNILDERLSNVMNVSANIGFDTEILNYINYPPEDNSKHYYTRELIQELNRYKSSNDLISEIYLYISEGQFVITSESLMSVRDIYQQCNFVDLSFDSFRSMLNEKKMSRFRFREKCKRNNQEKYVISYLQSLPVGTMEETKATLVILIDEEKLTGDIKWSANENFTFYGVNKSDKLLFYKGSGEKVLKYSRIMEHDSVFKEGISNFSFHVSSAMSDFEYVLTAHSNVIFGSANLTKHVMLIWSIASIVLGIILAFFMARRLYFPVRRIISKLGESVGRGKQEEKTNVYKNDFVNMEERIETILAERRDLQKLLENRYSMISSNILNNIFFGAETDKNIQESLAQIGLDLKYDSYLVVVMRINSLISDDEISLIKYAFKNISEELLNQNMTAMASSTGHVHMGILINMETGDTALEDVKAIMERIYQLFIAEFDVILDIAAGDIQDDISLVYKSYDNALKALEYLQLKNDNGVTDIKKINDNNESFYYPIELEMSLINAVKLSDIEAVDRILEHLFKKNFKEMNLSTFGIKCFYFDLISTALKIVNVLPDEEAKEEWLQSEYYNQIAQSDNVETLMETMRTLFEKLCMTITNSSNQKKELYKNEILEYVNKYCFNIDFNLNIMADSFKTNSVSLSVFFKKTVGVNFTDYIRKIRIEKAKEYLKQTNIPLQQISEKVGYSNVNIFIRNFKKETNMTPTMYREELGD